MYRLLSADSIDYGRSKIKGLVFYLLKTHLNLFVFTQNNKKKIKNTLINLSMTIKNDSKN
jgi:hypothetical protein